MPVPAISRATSATSRAAPRPQPRHGGRRWWLWLAGAPVLLLVVLVCLVLVLLAGDLGQQCPSASPAPGDYTGPGALGAVAGTGITAAQLDTVRSASPYRGSRLIEGSYMTSAYGPPWGGLQGAGQWTSGGLAIAGGAPHWYMIAVDPLLIAHGELVYAWPNPFAWRGPFLAADTGAAIRGRRIDFYDWRGRLTQRRWGLRPARLSSRPLVPGGPDITSAPAEAGCSTPLSRDVGERIGQLARAQLGRGPRIPGFQPPAVTYAWCAWFATNIWRQAGVPITVSGWSGYPYDWAHANGLLFKSVGRAPRAATPPAGSALMYGHDPQRDSEHVNLVDRVLPDGSFMVTGGNQDGHRVTRYGPCRLRHTDPAQLTGPGCDERPIYGIAMPSDPQAA